MLFGPWFMLVRTCKRYSVLTIRHPDRGASSCRRQANGAGIKRGAVHFRRSSSGAWPSSISPLPRGEIRIAFRPALVDVT